MAYSIGPSSGRGTGMRTTRGPSRTYNWGSMDMETLKKYSTGELGNRGLMGPAKRVYDQRLKQQQEADAKKAQQTATYQSLMDQAMADREAAKKANLERYQQAMDVYSQIESTYAPGGAMEKAGLAQIERTKKQDLAKAMQAAVSSGLGKTTRAAFSGARWEAEVGQQARLNLESQLTQQRTQAMRDKAGLIERREDVGPDFNAIANLAMKIGGG